MVQDICKTQKKEQLYTCKNLTTCCKSENKPSASCVRMACYKLLTTCNNLVDIIRLVTRLFQQGCYNHDITILLQPCNILVISRPYQTCYNNLVTSLIMKSSLLQVVNNLFQTCYNKPGTSRANTIC